MKTSSLLRVVLGVLAAVWLGGSFAGAAGYEQTLATAKAFAAEKSWAKAQEAYTAALAVAPDPEAKRWCELGRVDAGWRAVGNNAGTEGLLTRIAEFENLLERYQRPSTEKDEFWFAAMESWADFRAERSLSTYGASRLLEEVYYQNQMNRSRGTGLPERQVSRFLDLSASSDADRLVICEALGEQRPTPETRRRYLEAVRALVINPDRQWDHRLLGSLIEQVRTASRLAETADDRAWFALVAQLLTETRTDTNADCARRWGEVLALAKGTKWEAVAAGAELYWRVSTGWAPDRAPGTPVDLPARVAECDGLLMRLATALGLTGDSFVWPVAPTDPEQAWSSLVLSDLMQWRGESDELTLQLSMSERLRTGQAARCFYGAAGADRVEFSLERLTVEQWIVANGHSRAPESDGPGRTVVREWSQALGDARYLLFRSGESDVAPSLPAGFYLLKATAYRGEASTKARSCFIVTGCEPALLVSSLGADVLNCCEADGIKPLAGRTVRGVVGDRSGKKDPVRFGGVTDASGRAELQYEFEPTPEHTVFAGLVGEDPVFLERRRTEGRTRGSAYRANVVLDRELYRPGETLRWKVILREERDRHSALPVRDTKVRMSVFVDGTELLKETELPLSAFGTVAGEVPLPAGLSPGYGEILFKVMNASGDVDPAGGYSHFRVEHYRPPAVNATVTLASAPDSLRPGEEIAVRVVASYLSGGGVVGAPVECRITAYKAEKTDDPGGGASHQRRKPSAVPEVMSLAGVTDETGTAVFRYRLPDLAEGRLLVVSTVIPSGVAEISKTESWAVSETGFLCEMDRGEQSAAVPVGSRIEFSGLITDGTHRSAEFVGTAQVIERSWQEVWRLPDGRVVTGAESAALADASRSEDDEDDEVVPPIAEPDMPKCMHAGYREVVVSEVPIRTEADGRLNVSFTPTRPGIYALRISRDGVVLSKDGRVWPQVIAIDDATSDLALPYSNSAAYILDRHPDGDGLRVLVILPEGKKRGWLVVNSVARASAQPFELKGRVGVVQVNAAISPETECDVAVYPEDGASLSSDYFALRSGGKAPGLAIDIAAADALCRPGASTTVKLQVNASTQAQKPAELWVNVVDEAVVGLTRAKEWRRKAADFRPTITGSSHLCRKPRDRAEATMPVDPRHGVRTADPMGKPLVRRLLRRMSLADYSALSVLQPECAWGGRNKSKSFACLAAPDKGRREMVVRTRFDATAFWAPQVVTDAKGEATVSFTYPDNLTQWRIEAYAVGADGNSFGTATAFTRTSLPFQARLNLPRFLVAGDSAAPSATLVNRTDAPLVANAELAVGGAVVPARASQATPLRVNAMPLVAQGEAQAAWPVRAQAAGSADFTLKAWAGAESDGMKLALPVIEDGVAQETAASGRLARGEQKCDLVLDLPQPLDPTRTAVRVQLSGSRAAMMLDALPYLVDYPYGCVEQTLSRFLPAVVAKRTLGELGFDATAVENRILGRETAADANRRTKTAGLARLDEVIGKSLSRLAEAQHRDGGFGWWPGAANGNLWMTAYAVWGLKLARDAGVEIPKRMSERASSALAQALDDSKKDWREAAAADARAWALTALAGAKLDERDTKRRAEAWRKAYAERDVLTATGRACLAAASATLGAADERAVLLRNLENGAERADLAGFGAAVHWGRTTGYWRASDGAVEATALTLLALLELDPQHPLVEPAMNWLVLNRRSGHWESTRATAFAVLALSRYLQVRGEAQGETEVEVLAGSAALGRVKLNRESLLAGAPTVVVPTAKLQAGRNVIALRRLSGDGEVYAVALAEAWAAGEAVKPAGHLAEVARGFVRQKATPTLVGTVRIVPEALPAGGSATAGEEVQAVVTVTVPNDLEYVMIEVPKPAGCEPLNPLSGWDARIRRAVTKRAAPDAGAKGTAPDGGGAPSLPQDAAGRPIYREERDEKSVFFLDRIEAGTWEIRFGMRAVTPGDFRALPVQVEAMYVPEIRANSAAQRVRIEARN